MISECERLRNVDTRFATLGIGLAEGDLVAEFSLFGTLKTKPIGGALKDAVTSEKKAHKYRRILQALRERTNGPTK